MKLNNKNAEIYIPDGKNEREAIAKTTHMAISAHQDDIEIMAYDGVLKCFGSKNNNFAAVVVTNGAGSPRNGIYAEYTDEMMQEVRRVEQKKAAFIGEYSSLVLMDYTSGEVKDPDNDTVTEEITQLLLEAQPEVIYTHNPADKHDTHVAVTAKVIAAIRALPKDKRPKKVFGGEVWRGLDWMCDSDRLAFDVDYYPNMASALLEVFDSQISGGKRYDLATVGRRLANATYAASHATDTSQSLSFAMDLTPLIRDDSLGIKDFVMGYLKNFEDEVSERIDKFSL